MVSDESPPAPAPGADELFPLLYAELRSLARVMMANRAPGQTLQPTALVHEAYLRMGGGRGVTWTSPRHFFLTAAQAMRQILVDQYRRKQAQRHGGGRHRVDLEYAELAIEPPSTDLIALDQALAALEAHDPRKCRIVTLKCFAGLSLAEIAGLLDVSLRTAERDWAFARAFLLDFMSDRPAGVPR
ncbi:MAG: ECF-type sigma factor [Candidatus Eiseniibacteriota bacterium]